MENKQVKVGDIISIKKDVIDGLDDIISQLESFRDNYLVCDKSDLAALETIKVGISGLLTRYAVLFGQIKKYKGGNHTYLEDERKKLKSDYIKVCIKEGDSFSKAKEVVYSHEGYDMHMDIIIQLKGAFIKYEEVLIAYRDLLQSVFQTISIAGKGISYNIQ